MSKIFAACIFAWAASLSGAEPAAAVPPADPELDRFKAEIEKYRAAAKSKQAVEVKKVVAEWCPPEPEKWFRERWGEKGAALAAGHAKWRAQFENGQIPGHAAAAAGSEAGGVSVVGRDRKPATELEDELLKALGKEAKEAVLYSAWFFDSKPYYMLRAANLYFLLDGGVFRCLGSPGFLHMPAAGSADGVDPLQKQEPTVESLARLIEAFDVACKTRNKAEIKRLTAQWRIPNEEQWFKANWGEEAGARLAKRYPTVADKYTNFEQSEMSDRFWQGLNPRVGEMKPDPKVYRGPYYKSLLEKIEGKSPLFSVSLRCPNTGKAGWGGIPFIYLDGAFRMPGMGEYLGDPNK